MRQADQFRWAGFAGVILLVMATLVKGNALLLLVAGVTGMGLLVLAWLLLGRMLTTSLNQPTSQWLHRTMALWTGPLLVAPPLFSGDVHSYLAQGAISWHGFDPYVVGPAEGLGAASVLTEKVSALWRNTPSPYGPLFTTLQEWIFRFTGENQITGVLAHRFLEIAGLLLIIWAVPRLAKASGASESVALWLGVLNPLVLWHFVAGAHNDSLMLGLMLAGVALALDALGERIDWLRLTIGVALIAAGALVKLPAVVALAVVGTALARRYGATFGRLVLSGAAMLLAMVLVSIMISISSGVGSGWLRTAGTSGEVNSWLAPTNWFGFLTGSIGSLLGLHITQTMISVGKYIGYVLIIIGISILIRRQLTGRLAALPALGAMLGLVVVFGPAVQPWYLLWAAIPLAACMPAGRWRSALTAVIALFAVLLPPLSGTIIMLVIAYLGSALIVAFGAIFLFQQRKNQNVPALAAGLSEPLKSVS